MSDPAIRVVHLYVSPGHNFFGHYGRPASDHPTVEVPEVRCRRGWGIEGDRFYGYRPGYKGQVTFFDHAVYRRLCAQFAVSDKTPAAFRRNVVCAGVDLNALIGEEFLLQGVRFRGHEECRPCFWMNQSFAPGAEQALRGWGGLRAEVLSDGVLQTSPPAPTPAAARAAGAVV